MSKVRVLVVEDSLTVRRHLVAVLDADPDIEVIAEAEDGKTAIELCERLRPDVVTLDMMLPIMTGLAATEYIMAYCPTPIVIVSSSTNRGELFKTYDALAAGAVEAMEKPGGDEFDGYWERRFASTVKLLAKIKVITHIRGRWRPPAFGALRSAPVRAGGPYRCVALGASTGGPAALLQILRELPSDFRLPILLVIHLSPVLGGGFADWMGSQLSIPVAFAVDGEPLPPCGAPRVVLAPPDRHLVLRAGRLRLTGDAERFSCRPSVDVLFQSVA
ncbi:MAG: response regulator, partial [Planctomycetia bacterium]|nr:response regulator [Planctomycetia bacterium]